MLDRVLLETSNILDGQTKVGGASPHTGGRFVCSTYVNLLLRIPAQFHIIIVQREGAFESSSSPSKIEMI